MKEITGSGIFVPNGEDDPSEAGSANPNKTGVRMYQVLNMCVYMQEHVCFYILSVMDFG